MVIALANNCTEPIYFFLLFPCLLVSTISSVLFIKPVLFHCICRSWKVSGLLGSSCEKLIKKRKPVVGALNLLDRKCLLQSSPDS